MKIIDGKLTLKCDDGTELKADMTDAKIAAIVQSCGYHVADMGEVHDVTGDGAVTMDDIAELFRQGANELTRLHGDGDFRSPECLEFLDQSDIVVTNPPFSKFREFVSTVMEHGKDFIIIGNVNAITYKEFFPYLKDNKAWIGASIHSGDRKFYVPDSYPLEAAGCGIDDDGRRYIRVK